jgi:hypothetical protein
MEPAPRGRSEASYQPNLPGTGERFVRRGSPSAADTRFKVAPQAAPCAQSSDVACLARQP